jgi:ABC-2 type transport system permease protein
MSTLATDRPLDVAPIPRMLAAQIRAVLTFYWRVPAIAIFSIALPLMFFLFFGISFGHQSIGHGFTLGDQLMAQLAAYATGSVFTFNIGVGQSNRRAQKLDLLQRAAPLPGWIVILAEIVGGLVLALISVLCLFVFATLAGGVRLDAVTYGGLLLRVLLGGLPLLALGLAIGYGGGTNSAPALASLIYLPMSFASGMWIPIQELPKFLQKVALYLPTYHYTQLVLAPFGESHEALWQAVAWLGGWGVVLLAVAIRLYRLDYQRKFS